MTAIEPSRKDIGHLPENKKYSSSLRFWHWANAVVITGSLLTVLVNSTVLAGWGTMLFVQGQLKKSGVNATSDQLKPVIGGLRDRVWQYHIYFGLCLVALLLFRFIAEFFHLTDQKLTRKIKVAYAEFKNGRNKLIARHELVVKTLYAMFYIVLCIMAITGLCLVFEDDIPALHKMHFIKDIHGFCMYLVLAFIVVHLAGVFLAERKDSKGIVSDMINGGQED
ncbi:MAG TPA: cytochrome b/b6 domain-containing protein [Mucilaginibacter sp.]|jgi:cytochrome b561|nr:cytochrome b/b6 domain-containing protein [Mucilaginibacter sp.]